MYTSPIDVIYGEMQMQVEGDIYKAVQKVGINVYKEELLKALQYDRGQYEQGYKDGYVKAIDDFADKVMNFEDYIEPVCIYNGTNQLYSGKDISKMIKKIAEEMRCAE